MTESKPNEDHPWQGKLLRGMSPMTQRKQRHVRSKAEIFVAHIQAHLDAEEYAVPTLGRKIPRGKVGCKICEKSIDRIYADSQAQFRGKT